MLFQEITAFFRNKVAFPPEATEGITDEQYLRNVVEVLYRKTGPSEVKTGGTLSGLRAT
jgi:hypothetical protein